MIFLTLMLLNIGLIATLFPKLHGPVWIFATAILYGCLTNFLTLNSQRLTILLILLVLAEVGSSWLRFFLTKKYPLSPAFCVNSFAGNLGGLAAASCIFGKTAGLLIWQVFVGKSYMPRLDTVGVVLARLAIAALFRFICALIMAGLVITSLS